MRVFRSLAAALLLALPAAAWNFTGHRIIAAIAYDRLTPAARAKVDALIQAHPDYATLFTAGAPAEPAARARAAFLYASTWPDVIRGDARFYDETKPEQMPTPVLPGFQNMGRHLTWHYYDIPYAPDGAKTTEQPPPHALSELRRILATIATAPVAEAAYDLPWLEHVEGDVHNPLHATSRFLKSEPKGDAGGNFVYVTPTSNLHAFWDSQAGTDASDAYVNKYANDLTAEYPAPGSLSLNPRRWLQESYRLVRSDVYSFGLATGTLATGTKEQPITLSAGYATRARRIARQRIALAGYRLAAVLNDKFK